MNRVSVIAALFSFALSLLTGCVSTTPKETAETIPAVCCAPNSSGLTLGEVKTHGPINLLGVTDCSPDFPSGATASIERTGSNSKIAPLGKVGGDGCGKIIVSSIEQPAKYDLGTGRFTNTIRQWRLLIAGDGTPDREAKKVLYNSQLDEIPRLNAGRGEPAKLRRRTFPWGKAVLFVTTGYAQGKTGEVVSNDRLTLVVQGFTNDGRYTLNGHFSLHHPKLPNSPSNKPQKGMVVFDFDSNEQKAARWLDAQPDESFSPTLQQCEIFLGALQIEPPI